MGNAFGVVASLRLSGLLHSSSSDTFLDHQTEFIMHLLGVSFTGVIHTFHHYTFTADVTTLRSLFVHFLHILGQISKTKPFYVPVVMLGVVAPVMSKMGRPLPHGACNMGVGGRADEAQTHKLIGVSL